ncbi:MAG: T9SS type A sorting domain-containing protein, partial [Flavobacteriales bacterium]|nr:T9SS type A sorting domain-containing protein [Flavobacteriales bacterium]
DIFVAKFTGAGAHNKTIKIGDLSDDVGQVVELSSTGIVFVGMDFQGTADMDPGAGTVLRTSNGLTDIDVAGFDANLNYIQDVQIGGTGIESIKSFSPNNGTGGYTITGLFSNTVDFDFGAGTALQTSAGGVDMFVATYSGGGAYLNSIKIGDLSDDVSNASVLDGSGNTFITGNYSGSPNFNPKGAPVTESSDGGTDDIAIVAFDALLNNAWVTTIGSNSSQLETGLGMTITSSGNLLVSGVFEGSNVDFDPSGGKDSLITSAGGGDIYLAEYDVAGNFVSASSHGNEHVEQGFNLLDDGSGNIYITGKYEVETTFDPTGSPVTLTSNGDFDGFLAKLGISDMGGGPLPIELGSFTARLTEEKDVELLWSTFSEVQNDYFIVERSIDGETFHEIGRVDGNLNSNTVQRYNFVDQTPVPGINYYRLLQVDLDGVIHYERTVFFEFKSELETPEFRVYPNPNNGPRIFVQGSHLNESGEILVVLNDVLGNEVFSKVILTNDMEHFVMGIDIDSKIPPGTYTIRGSSDHELFNKIIIIK